MSIPEESATAPAPLAEMPPAAKPLPHAPPDFAVAADSMAAPTEVPIEPASVAEPSPGIAEPAPTALIPQPRAKTKGVADLVFLVDVSGTMATCIDALRKNIEAFIDSLSHGDANNAAPVKDWRAKVVGYRDIEMV